MHFLVAFIERLKSLRIVQLFTIYLRYLIGCAFVFASIPKILGERFTLIPIEHPVGFYFEAMYRTGFYWNFLGWGQLIAAVLMMTQRYAALGALLFYPIIINIWLVTWSVGFQGTPVVTFLMFLGTTYLLVWEYRRIVPFFQRESAMQLLPSRFDDSFMRKPVWAVLGVHIIVLNILMRLDFGHAGWYVSAGFFPALGLLLFYLFKLDRRRRGEVVAAN